MVKIRHIVGTLGVVGVVSCVAGVTYMSKYSNPHIFGTSPPLPQHTAPSRAESFNKLREANSPQKALDVLIIGGGATGAGIAVDAATRGMTVGLVEMNDYASGTSCRSTKLIHGGVRYLEKAVFGCDWDQLMLVFEALKERGVMIHQAPHICEPIGTVIPCYSLLDVPTFWCGMKLYDLLAYIGKGLIQPSSRMLPIKCFETFPEMSLMRKTDNSILLCGVEYFDGQMDDARLCLSAILTASCFGAATVNHCKVTGLSKVTDNKGVMAAKIHDEITGEATTVYAKSIVNATGPFSDSVQNLVDDDHKNMIIPSSGTHITLPEKYAPKGKAMIVPSSDGRVVFVVPWKGKCIAGTTDQECTITEDPRATVDEVDFIRASLSNYFGEIPKSDVLSTWCGIRPLAVSKKADAHNTSNIVREHLISIDDDNRMLSIAGGKWTTYRKMARDAVDHLVNDLGVKSSNVCTTEDILLLGAHEFENVKENFKPSSSEVTKELQNHWLYTYGDRIAKVEEISKTLPSGFKPLCKSSPVVEGEVLYAVQHEHCETISDFLSRRSRLSFLNVVEARDAMPRVADIMAVEKGWSNTRKAKEIAMAKKHLQTFVPLPSSPKPRELMAPVLQAA